MYRRILPLLIFVISTATFAGSAVQTEWSGGPGVWGSVTDWGNQFFQETDISWLHASGCIMLQGCVEHVITGYYPSLIFVHADDIDGDDDTDVLTATSSGTNSISWWENLDESGTAWSQHVIDVYFPSMCIHSEDIDGDGDSDVLCAGTDLICWWENTNGLGTAWAEHTVDSDFQGANSVYSEDIDSDGDMDVLGAARYADDITWWENLNGVGTSWSKFTVDGSFDDAMSVHAEDINGDGDMDILGAAYLDGDIAWWENLDGSGTAWMEYTVDGSFPGATCVFSEDVDSDGDMDILGTTMYADEITWWENIDGTGTSWNEHPIDATFDGAHAVHATDMNGDGAIDVLAVAFLDNDITWWQNSDTSPGVYWTEHTVEGDFYYAFSVYPADIDGNSSLDILGGAHFTTWWDLTSYRSEGSLESSVFDTEGDPDWDSIDWDSQTPSGTSVSFQVRASDNQTVMGAWSDTLQVPGFLEGILADGDQYIQYRVILQTSDPDTTPVLNDITVIWDPTSIEETTEPVTQGIVLLPVAPNPVVGSPVIIFGLPEPVAVELSIFDLSGRMVSDIHEDEYSMGYHDVLIGELSPGIYFCRMVSGDFTATQRFVVID
ncbi:MAG: T9SS type A sorting domain-containing protein [Candidatus Aegiribacteria sp.]|nr:T9SS type A sorting domain-containing protein [Candidatus Aegiribacteria sp.]